MNCVNCRKAFCQLQDEERKREEGKQMSVKIKASDKLNAADKGGPYVKLPNGYVAVAV